MTLYPLSAVRPLILHSQGLTTPNGADFILEFEGVRRQDVS